MAKITPLVVAFFLFMFSIYPFSSSPIVPIPPLIGVASAEYQSNNTTYNDTEINPEINVGLPEFNFNLTETFAPILPIIGAICMIIIVIGILLIIYMIAGIYRNYKEGKYYSSMIKGNGGEKS